MKKRTVIEEAYRIYWALAVMGECLASLEPEVGTDGKREENI